MKYPSLFTAVAQLRACLGVCALAAGLVSCGAPLVPNPTALADLAVTRQMTLALECRFKALDPQLPALRYGPEPDSYPLLIPRPGNEGSQAFLLLPRLASEDNRRILQADLPIYIENQENQALVASLSLSPDRSSHDLELAAQLLSAELATASLNTWSNGNFGRTWELSRHQDPGADTPELFFVTRSTNGGSNRSLAYRLAYSAKPFNDTTLMAAFPSEEKVFPGAMEAWDFGSWQFRPASPSSLSYNQPPLFVPLGVIPVAPAWSRSLVFGSGNELHTLGLDSSTPPPDQAFIGTLQFDTRNPGSVTLVSSPVIKPLDNYTKSGDWSNCFSAWHPSKLGGWLVLSSYWPSASLQFNAYDIRDDLDLGWLSADAVAMAFPVVRVLGDGTALGLRDNQWVKVNFRADGTMDPQAGMALPTGSLQFLYESETEGVAWLWFSQAIVANGDPGRERDLLMRVWKIRRDDFVAGATVN